MHLVQLIIPLRDNHGQRISGRLFKQTARELTATFGGVTAYVHSPAVGAWQDGAAPVQIDEVVIFEVMTSWLEKAWWKEYRTVLEDRFGQKEMVLRSLAAERL